MKYYKISPILLLAFLILMGCTPKTESDSNYPEGPITLLPENPHYFLYKGEPTVLITSAEHYGAVLNMEFDFIPYLETLKTDGMNYTRIFMGSYFEIYGDSFGIQRNTLAPRPGKLIAPWNYELTSDSTYIFDTNSWNEAYFERLNDFMTEAAERDIIVEVTLFSSIYRDEHWNISPENPLNWKSPASEIPRRNAHTLDNGDLLSVQEAYVKKIVSELNSFDNFFFEIQNEPWSDRTVPVYNIINKEELAEGDWTTKSDFADDESLAWQTHIAALISDTESALPKSHLIAQNYCNFRASVPEVSEYISIINFHYAWPDAASWNYHYDKVLGFDESGFAGSSDQVYRRQAWQFIFSGGGLYNNLDYSFFPGKEDGSGENSAPGGGSPELRAQLSVLSEFIHEFPLQNLVPDPRGVCASPGTITYTLSDEGIWGIFIRSTGTSETSLTLCIPDGSYLVTWLSPVTGNRTSEELRAENNRLEIPIEMTEGELALKIEENHP